MRNKPNHVGIDEDVFGGMTPTGTIIRDAWVFGIIPDSENCAGWNVQGIQSLYDKVSNLPPDLRERHQRIYEAAVQKAKALGWDPELNDEDT